MTTKIKKLRACIRSYESMVVAFSGGVDSTLLLTAAVDELGQDAVVAVTAEDALSTKKEQSEARTYVRQLGVRHVIVDTGMLRHKQFLRNPRNRCYLCKKKIMRLCIRAAHTYHCAVVCDGANKDDLRVYRPGNKAADELGIVRPLIVCGFSKKDVRAAARQMRLPVWNKEAQACLASRFPYGEHLNENKLAMVARGECLLRSFGFSTVRLRWHGDIVRIELRECEMAKIIREPLRKKIITALKKIGFHYIVLDLQGHRSGSMDEVTKG